MNFFHTHKTELILILLSLTLHLIVFTIVIHENNGSFLNAVRGDDGFFELAENVLAGNGFSWSSSAPYLPNPLRTPGYSYVLAALIGIFGTTGAAIIQLLIASMLPLFGLWLAESITHSRKIGIVTGAILALDPTLALLSFQFYTETLFLVLFFPWIIISLKYLEKRDFISLIVSAILIGCAILVKASVQYIPILFAVFILWRHGMVDWRRGTAHLCVYLLIVGALVAPWVVRNKLVFGVLGLSAQGPFVLYTNLAPAVLTVAHNSSFADELKTFLTEDEYLGNTITLANSTAYKERALEIVHKYPIATLFVANKSLFTFFTNDGMYTILARSGYKPHEFLATLIVARLVWVAITLAALLGSFFLMFTERSPRNIFLLLLIAYFALTSTVAAFGTNPRYRLPVDPIIISLAAIGIIQITKRIRNFKLFLYLSSKYKKSRTQT